MTEILATFDLDNIVPGDVPDGIPATAWRHILGAAGTARALGSVGAKTCDPATGVWYSATRRKTTGPAPWFVESCTPVFDVTVIPADEVAAADVRFDAAASCDGTPGPLFTDAADDLPFVDPANAPTVAVVVVEYPSDSGESPAVYVATSEDAAFVLAVDHVIGETERDDEFADFMAEHPRPTTLDAAAAHAWYDEYHDLDNTIWLTVTTEPVHGAR